MHHTDADREYAYDRDSHVGVLDKALDQADANGWIIVSMKDDWKQIFPDQNRWSVQSNDARGRLTSFIAALFSMMNPIGGVGVFAGLTADRQGNQGRRIAWACAVAVAITLLIVTWGGSLVLGFFGITVDSLRAAGV